MQYPMNMSNTVVNIFIDGKLWTKNSTDIGWDKLIEYLKSTNDYDKDTLLELLDTPTVLNKLTFGAVTVEDDEVMYQGVAVDNSLTRKLLAVVNEGGDPAYWAKFLDNLMQNPSYKSRESLYNFLDHFTTPITPDGYFLAFKRVKGDFKDIHTGTFDNSPGKLVQMPRREVDDDSNRTCSSGLHACASKYLEGFHARQPGYKVVVVKINPKDVVSVPVDYQFSKLRVCEYLVLSEVDDVMIDTLSSVHTTTYGYEEDSPAGLDDYGSVMEDDDYYSNSYYDDSYTSY